ncbi:ShlB/FhaC/HecB family hemolysin secretion/activation protein, partial [bacterium]|nr:ShlB/FhaC/HecB family hemolysin secretion/activation protein [bacterium]
YLDDNDIAPGKIVNANHLRSTLQNINAEDYMKGSVSFSDNEESEEYSDVSLDIKDRFPIDIDLRYDNQGRELIGTQRGVLYAGMHNVTGHGDRLLGTLAFTSRSIGVGGLYSIPVAKNDTRLNLGYTYSHVKLGKQLKEYDISGSSHNFFVGLSRRLARGENYRLYGDLTFDFRNSSSKWKYDNVYTLPSYRTRTVRASVTDIADDFYGRWLFNGAITGGIPFLDGTDYNKDRALPSNNFVKLNAGAARMQMLPLNSMALLQVNGQYANRNLYPSEKMQVGGIASVRGFDEAYALGDYGLTTSIELRVPVPFLGMVLPEKLKFIDDSIRLAAFYDFGWFGDRFNPDGSDFMMSVGPGIVVKLTKYLSGNVYWGFPLGHRADDVDTCRFHFTVTSNIL